MRSRNTDVFIYVPLDRKSQKVLRKGLKKVTELKKVLKKVRKLKKVIKKVNSLKKALKKVMNSKITQKSKIKWTSYSKKNSN